LIASVVIGGLLMLGMVAVAWHAARALPAGARVPLNAGVPEYSVWLPKAAGLAAWLVAGTVTFAAFAAVTLDGLSADWATSLRVVLLPCAMLVVLAAQAGAVIVAERLASGPANAAGPGASAASARVDGSAETGPPAEPQAETPAEAAAVALVDSSAEAPAEAAAEAPAGD